MNHLRFLMPVAWAVLLAGCTPNASDNASRETTLPKDAAPTVQMHDLSESLERTLYAFHPSDKAWHATFASHRTIVDETGLAVLPNVSPSEGEATPTAFSLKAAHIARDSSTPRPHASVMPVKAAAGIERAGPLAVERIRNVAEGVEQSWVFDSRPEGRGALVVRQEVAGLTFVRSDETGLHFRDDAAQVGVRYGHATWIDASGVETALPSLFENEAIVHRVPSALVDGSRFPAVLDPIIEVVLEIDKVVYSPQNGQSAPSVASNGSGFYVAWQNNAQTQTVAVGARVHPTGDEPAWEIVEKTPQFFSDKSEIQTQPAVTAFGEDYRVIWKTSTNRLRGSDVEDGSGAVHVRDSTEIPGKTSPANPALASIGEKTLIAWDDATQSGTRKVYGRIVGSASAGLEPTVISGNTEGTKSNPAVASNGTFFLVAWQDYRASRNDIYATRVDENGVVLDESEVLVSSGTSNALVPSVAAIDGAFVVVWAESSGAGAVVYARRVEADGTVSAPAIRIATTATPAPEPAVGSNARELLVAWTDTPDATANQVLVRRLSRQTLELLDDAPHLLASHARAFRSLAVAGVDRSFLVVWERYAKATGSSKLLAASTVAFNTPPAASNHAFVTDEDVPLTLTLDATDADGDELVFHIHDEPAHGTLAGDGPDFVYTPDRDWFGDDSFTYSVNDGSADSDVANVAIQVNPVNDAPVTENIAVELDEDGSVVITLTANDVENDPLTFRIDTPPEHGSLEGAPPTLIYRPAPDFFGADSFTYIASDGELDSNVATVHITVHPVNDAPVAQNATHALKQGETLTFALVATDVDNDVLSYIVTVQPTGGVLEHLEDASYVYAPNRGFRGEDVVKFIADDGQLQSNEATVTITVENLPPVVDVSASSLEVGAFEPVVFTTVATDPGGDELAFTWDFGDGKGSDEQSPTHIYTTPGTYAATVTASDGLLETNATLEIVVGPARPRLSPAYALVEGDEGAALTLEVTVIHPNADEHVSVTWDFGDGSPAVPGRTVEHTYADDGEYTIRITAIDGQGAEGTASWSARIRNVAPVPKAQATLTVAEGEQVRAQLEATDPAGDADPLTWTLIEGPGGLSEQGAYAWVTGAGDAGTHLVKARVSDGDGGEGELEFTVIVTASGTAPGGDDDSKTPDSSPDGGNKGCGGCSSDGSAPAGLLWLSVLGVALARPRRA